MTVSARAGAVLGAATLLLGVVALTNVEAHSASLSGIVATAAVMPEASPDTVTETAFVLPEADTLSQLVTKVRNAEPPVLEEQTRCLASAVYYESMGEPLAGQLAVAQVVLNRVEQGRYGADICTVVTAPKQFGFVRDGQYPAPAKNRQWRIAKAIALIAVGNGWPELVGDATHFHAIRVHPQWNLQQVATIGEHIFYR